MITMKNQFTSILLALAIVSLTGCSSMESTSEGALVSAEETSHNYDTLGASLASSIDRLESLRKMPGSAESFLKNLNEIDAAVAKDGEALKSSRQNLLEHGKDHVSRLNKEASMFTDADLAKKVSRDAEALGAQYAAYEKASASVTDSMDVAVKYADDIRRMMDINSAPAGIDNCIGTVRKIEDSLENAKRRIPDAKSALEDLRKQLPKPASVGSHS
jgi:chromosome segregation ATPase